MLDTTLPMMVGISHALHIRPTLARHCRAGGRAHHRRGGRARRPVAPSRERHLAGIAGTAGGHARRARQRPRRAAWTVLHGTGQVKDSPGLVAVILFGLALVGIALGVAVGIVRQDHAVRRCVDLGWSRAEVRWDFAVYCIRDGGVPPAMPLETLERRQR